MVREGDGAKEELKSRELGLRLEKEPVPLMLGNNLIIAAAF